MTSVGSYSAAAWKCLSSISASLFFLVFSLASQCLAKEDQDISLWNRFVEAYSSYFQRTYGPEVKSRYDLYLREIEQMGAPEYGRCQPPVLSKKTLDRWVDGIIFEGRYLPDLLNEPIERLRVLAYTNNQWQTVPFQIDEITSDGMKVLPEGPQPNADKANMMLDEQDEIVLMAHDVGDRVDASLWPEGVVRGYEVEVTDPRSGKKGWFYVVAYDTHEPNLSPLHYRGAYVPQQEVTGYLAYSPYYLVWGKTIEHHGKKYNQIFYHGLFQSPLAGGTATNYADRLKWRLRVRFLFGTMSLHFDEDSLTGEFFAWKSGPVRGTYRVWAVANLPMGLKSPRIIADVIQVGENIISTTTILKVPINPGYVITDLTTRIGTDLNPDAIGMTFHNSNNTSGALINGAPDPSDTKLNTDKDSWRLIYGQHGCVMNRSYWSDAFVAQARGIRVYMVDDVTKTDPPESHKGQFGAVYSEATVGNLKAGEYAIGIEWYFLNNFYRAEGPCRQTIEEYLAYQDAPLKLMIQGKSVCNKSLPTLGTIH